MNESSPASAASIAWVRFRSSELPAELWTLSSMATPPSEKTIAVTRIAVTIASPPSFLCNLVRAFIAFLRPAL